MSHDYNFIEINTKLKSLNSNNDLIYKFEEYTQYNTKVAGIIEEINSSYKQYNLNLDLLKKSKTIDEALLDEIIVSSTRASDLIDLKAKTIIANYELEMYIEKNINSLSKVLGKEYEENIKYLVGLINGAKITKNNYETKYEFINDFRKYYENHFLKNLDNILRN